MPVIFEHSRHGQCMTPVSGTGSQMLVCGEPTMPGRTCCPECRKRLYVAAAPIAIKNVNRRQPAGAVLLDR